MEKLKFMVPENLKRQIEETSAEDLPSSCSSLLTFLQELESFHHIIGDMAVDPKTAGLCGKNKEVALQSKSKGNRCLSSGDYADALDHYSQALRVAPVDADDMQKNLVATLYLNRASVLLKMGLHVECVRDCDRALQISPCYAKAWYRRGKAHASLGKYEDAVQDFDVAKSMELSSSGKKQIENEMKIALDQHGSSSSSIVLEGNKFDISDEPCQIEVKCVITPDKGRGMASVTDIPKSSLIHNEEPYAVIILKQCRETYCHYCLNELPADRVPCLSCSIPLYCSQHCQIKAGGQTIQNYRNEHNIPANLSDSIKNLIAEVTIRSYTDPDAECIPEHKHECQGAHWPMILPSEIVLAGRIVARFITERGCFMNGSILMDELKLSHNFLQMPPQSKLELLIYSILLLCCLQHSYIFKLPVNGLTISQIAILVLQIRVNSISIVRMKSIDIPELLERSGKFSCGRAQTCDMKQVRVGQAIYKAGSLFNHSCKPNVHVYFLARTLCIRSTEVVPAGCPLELSYGPQVGQWDFKDRLKFLEDEYSFRCQCSSCSEVNLPDLVLNAFCCVNPNCSGIVLDGSTVSCEKLKLNKSFNFNKLSRLEPHLQANNRFYQMGHGYCLKCGSYCDLGSSRATAEETWVHFRRIQEAIISKRISNTTISDALESLNLLRSTLHPYNRRLAEAEDYLAQAFVSNGELNLAMDHCKASIEILEKLYGPNHIVIGYELLKLSSIQQSLDDDNAAVDSISRMREIFKCYYGSHVNIIFPYLKSL